MKVSAKYMKKDMIYFTFKQQYWQVPTQGIEGQGPKHGSDLRAGTQSSPH